MRQLLSPQPPPSGLKRGFQSDGFRSTAVPVKRVEEKKNVLAVVKIDDKR